MAVDNQKGYGAVQEVMIIGAVIFLVELDECCHEVM